MYTLSHPNVMSLTGVCLDTGGGPAVVMPFMGRGSVLHYLKKERGKLVPRDDADCSVVCIDINNKTSSSGFQRAFLMMYLLDCPSDLRCAKTAAWNVFTNFQGDGVSSKRENYTQRPCCQKLHVSSKTHNTMTQGPLNTHG